LCGLRSALLIADLSDRYEWIRDIIQKRLMDQLVMGKVEALQHWSSRYTEPGKIQFLFHLLKTLKWFDVFLTVHHELTIN